MIVQCGENARLSLMHGIDLVADLVATTIGPAGRAVLSARNHTAPVLLRGGNAIANEVVVEGPGLRAGSIAMRQLASDVQATAGDGTSTALLLARALFHGASYGIHCGFSPVAVRQGIISHGEHVLAELAMATRPVTDGDALGIAVRAAGGDSDIGRIVQAAFVEAGPEGVVQVEAGHGREDDLDLRRGMTFTQGLLSANFATDPAGQVVELNKPLILLHQGPIDGFTDIARILEMIAQSGKELLIVADRFAPEAMATLVANRQTQGFRVTPMLAPGVGPWRALLLEDMAVATGATLVGATVGTALRQLRPDMLGRADLVTMTRQSTAVIGGKGEKSGILAHCDGIRLAIKRERYLAHDREQHQQRLARFQAGVARLRIGGDTPTVLASRQARATSAAAALRATSGGVIPGGAAALIHAGRRSVRFLPKDDLGRVTGVIFARALAAPMAALVENCGEDGRAVCHRLEMGAENQSYDVESRCAADADHLAIPASILTGALRAACAFAANMIGVEASVTK
ncbi:chaperonin GroEL [Rhizobium sp. CG5]|uniref:chaperonin GroEL n=1 Tax=Rhizobium sp. CG5 TaxID=2726076 RepID=UPI0025511959|nr:chaperonin GroEL [Rhizobium sp. CG5]